MADTVYPKGMNPKRQVDEAKASRKGKRSKKDPRIDIICHQLQVTIGSDDYVQTRANVSDYLIVLDKITEEFRKVRGPQYPGFPPVVSLTEVQLFNKKLHPIALYLKGGVTIHDLYDLHLLSPGRRFYCFRECDSVRLSLYWSYGALPVSPILDPTHRQIVRSLPPPVSSCGVKLETGDNTPPINTVSLQEQALAVDKSLVFVGDYAHMSEWPASDTSKSRAFWKNLKDYTKRSLSIFKLHSFRYAKENPGQSIKCGKLRCELLAGFHSRFIKECHAFIALLSASEDVFDNFMALNKAYHSLAMSKNSTQMKQSANKQLLKFLKNKRSFSPIFLEMIEHFPNYKKDLVKINPRIDSI